MQERKWYVTFAQLISPNAEQCIGCVSWVGVERPTDSSSLLQVRWFRLRRCQTSEIEVWSWLQKANNMYQISALFWKEFIRTFHFSSHHFSPFTVGEHMLAVWVSQVKYAPKASPGWPQRWKSLNGTLEKWFLPKSKYTNTIFTFQSLKEFWTVHPALFI